MKAVILAAAVTAGLTASSASAQASFCNLEGASYKCEYGVTERSLPSGEEKFVIGTDGAVWTNYSHDKGGWYSLDGFATSQVFVEGENTGNDFHTTIIVLGGDGKPWARERPHLGGGWTPWVPAPRPR